MHLIVGLLQSGYSVASIDVDFRQGSLSRYLANRRSFIKAATSDVTMPNPYTINPPGDGGAAADPSGTEQLKLLLEGGIINHDVVVVDTPDAVLVTSRARAQEVKAVVAALKESGRTDLV